MLKTSLSLFSFFSVFFLRRKMRFRLLVFGVVDRAEVSAVAVAVSLAVS